jgi:hypothetical protein
VRLTILVVSAAVSACGSSEWNRPAPGEVPIAVSALPGGRKTLADLYETAQEAETTLAITDRATWEAFWQRAVDDFTSGNQPAPVVDFGREMVLVAAAGDGGSDRELAIRVDGRRADSVMAIVHLRSSVPGLCGNDSFRAPMAAVRMRSDARPVAFRWEREDLACGRTP